MLDLNNPMPVRQSKLEGTAPKRASLRLPKELYDALMAEALKASCSLNELILQKLSSALPKEKVKKK